jgi:hypothetical protein
MAPMTSERYGISDFWACEEHGTIARRKFTAAQAETYSLNCLSELVTLSSSELVTLSSSEVVTLSSVHTQLHYCTDIHKHFRSFSLHLVFISIYVPLTSDP